MKRLCLAIASLVFGLFIGLSDIKVSWAIDCSSSSLPLDQIGMCISDLTKQLELSKAATAPLESEIKKLDSRIKSLQASINAAVAKVKVLSEEVEEREVKITQHYVLFAKKTRELYKKVRGTSMLSQLLSSVSSAEMTREIAYRGTASDQDRQLILTLSQEIIKLENDKKKLEDQKKSLASLQESLNKQAEFFKGEVAKAKEYQQVLSGQIAALSALQQAILGEKQETFQTTVGDVPLADDPNARPDYNPGFSPAFAAFSFGAPHFKGMSQYGAYGRAKSGQGVEEILRAYYGGGVEIKKDYSTAINIAVQGYGTVDIETYVKRIYEVPNQWGDNGGFEALKAQAVAARSYALAYTDNGVKSICATEACQVYKNANKGGKWEEAVNATRGWVLVANGKPLSAWYASTSGGYQESYTSNGYSTPGFWDAVGGRGGWTSQAYEKTAGSPWFYKGWYKSRDGKSCGRNHPWLTSEEMADILNAWTVMYQGKGDASRVVPLDINSCWGKSGSPYSMDELRGVGGFTSVSGVRVTYSSGGYTEELIFTTNKGDVTVKGKEFKDTFNLRAPGRIALKSGLFNIERK